MHDVSKYGAAGDGTTDDTYAVRAAAQALQVQGGGTLLFPENKTFLTGPFNLSSNALVKIQGNIIAMTNSKDWPLLDARAVWPQFGHGSDCEPGTEQCRLMHQALIFAWNRTNISLSGRGFIDGQGQDWWKCADNLDDHPCSGYARPHLLFMSNISRVKISDVVFKNSPDWTLHFSSVRDLHVTRVHVKNPTYARNSDGIDLDCVERAVVEDSIIHSGDDAVCIKSGIDWFGRSYAHPSRDILIRNITVTAGHGISVGSETSGSIFNVTFENLRLSGDLHSGNLHNGPRVKSMRGRGGVIDGLVFRNMSVKGAQSGFSLTLNYGSAPRTNASATPRLTNVLLENIAFEGVGQAGELNGLLESQITNVTLRNLHYAWGRNESAPSFGKCFFASGICEASTICPPCFTKI